MAVSVFECVPHGEVLVAQAAKSNEERLQEMAALRVMLAEKDAESKYGKEAIEAARAKLVYLISST